MNPNKKVGNYLLVLPLGQGQFGKVYKAVLIADPTQTFAIKCVDKSKIKQSSVLERLFQTEVNVMAKINHPNIMHLFELMETANNYYMVIQYCNNGDLDSHLKKSGRLSEEEAVYFLKQMSNGFQCLHKNKVMHRDVKLANMFLHDDKLVIGDFGFAKQGADITKTSLGSPLTMAPELLNPSGKGYTNKADLWSIGVSFYQMLFGRSPFDARNYEELRDRVKTQSGKNLRFSNSVQVSSSCRSLLSSLLQPDPDLRIEWKDFFEHDLFKGDKLLVKSEMDEFAGMGKRTMERQSEKQVNIEFAENRHSVGGTIRLTAPEELKVEQVARRSVCQTSRQTSHQELLELRQQFEQQAVGIRDRFAHERKVTVFIMHTVRRVRNLAKAKLAFGELTDSMMYAACILLRKGLLMNQFAVESLREGRNVFKLVGFDEFVKAEGLEMILRFFEEDKKIFLAFYQQMNARMGDEVSSLEYKQGVKNFNLTTFEDIPSLNQALINLLKYLNEQSNVLKLEPKVKADFCLANLQLFYSILSEESFEFVKDGKTFEWKSFEDKLTAENAQKHFAEVKL